MLAEAGLPSIEDRFYEVKARYLPKLLNSTNSVIDKDITSIINSKKPKRIISAIAKSLALTEELNLQLKMSKKVIKKAPWIFNYSCIDLSLSKLKKNETSDITSAYSQNRKIN
ncbi:hypothetical protein CVS40_11772 [Lucilia cuprina]|nr:hypothetical protein CVS40_11772 [Lucilia cuprina]